MLALGIHLENGLEELLPFQLYCNQVRQLLMLILGNCFSRSIACTLEHVQPTRQAESLQHEPDVLNPPLPDKIQDREIVLALDGIIHVTIKLWLCRGLRKDESAMSATIAYIPKSLQ